MSKYGILDYSTTPSENQDINGISILGTAKPSNLDDGMRAEMAHIAKDLVTRRAVKDTAYTAVKTDLNQLLEFSAEATLTTAAAATLTDGWQCKVYAQGGAVTINPNGSETVNGEEFILLQTGQSGILSVNNGNFRFEAFTDTARAAFLAHKNGTNQTFPTGAATKVTYGTAEINVGAHYDTTDSRFTPPAGKYRLSAASGMQLAGSAGGLPPIEIRKNGVLVRRGYGFGGGGYFCHAAVTCIVEANGTDYFEVFETGTTGANTISNYTILGGSEHTWFCGEAI
jgi:hypothetical protein